MKRWYSTFFFILLLKLSAVSFSQTVEVTDVVPGIMDSNPSYLVGIGDNLYFFFQDPEQGYNDSPAYLKKNGEVVHLSYPSNLFSEGSGYEFMEIGGKVVWTQQFYDNLIDDTFEALCTVENDSIVLITDYNNGNGIGEIEKLNNKLFFTYSSDTTGYELFSFDGLTMELAVDILPGATSSYPYGMFIHDNSLYFIHDSLSGQVLGKFDGVTLTDYNAPLPETADFSKTSIGSDLYYVSYLTFPPRIIHFNNGPIDTIYNPVNGLSFVYFTPFEANNELYVGGYNQYYSNMILKYDTATGVFNELLPSVSNDVLLNVYNDTIFFRGYHPTYGDGAYYAVAGVDTAVFITNSYIDLVEIENNKAYFSVNLGLGNEPYVWENDSLYLLADIAIGGNGSYPFRFTAFNDQLFVIANTSAFGREIYTICLHPVTPPVVPATQIVCEGSLVSDVTVSGNNLMFYDQSQEGNLVDVNNTILLTDSLFVSTFNSCPSERVHIPYTVSMLPNPTVAHYGQGYMTVVNASNTYQWIDCTTGDSIQGATNQSFQTDSNGVFSCVITNNDGCSTTSSCLYVVNLGIDESSQEVVSVYPNPANNVVTISTNKEISKIIISTLTGTVVQQFEDLNDMVMFSVSDFTNGVYLIQTLGLNEEMSATHKLVIEH